MAMTDVKIRVPEEMESYVSAKGEREELVRNAMLLYINLMNNSFDLNWSFRSQVTKFVKRFIKDPYRNEDSEWIRKLSETYDFSIKILIISKKP